MPETKDCKRCGHKKTWNGDDISCPFQGSEEFDSDNWNCGIINEIREICDRAQNGEDFRLRYQCCDNQNYVTIKTDYIEDVDLDLYIGLCLWVTWYKSRGKTDQMWLLKSDGEPVKPTFKQLQLIVNYYKNPKCPKPK